MTRSYPQHGETAERARLEPAFVEATVNYLAPMTERPWSDVIDLKKTNIVPEPVRVRVANAWRISANLSLGEQGFTVVRHRTAVTDFRDPKQVWEIYTREMENLILGLTGAARAIVKEVPLTRFSGDTTTIQPGYLAHIDFTYDSLADRMLERGIDVSSPDLRQYRRYCVYQTWRALSGPGQDSTLALTDGRSVAAAAAIEADFVRYQHRLDPTASATKQADAGLNQFCLYHPDSKHRWYYFPRLEPDEVLIWTGIDPNDRDMRVLHSAIRDSSQAGAPPRNSVESRVYTFFE